MNEEAALYRARVEVYNVGLGEWKVTAERSILWLVWCRGLRWVWG